MNRDEGQFESRDNARAPERLVEGLKALSGRSPEVPPQMDARIVAVARERVAVRRKRLVAVRWSAVAAAAAVVLAVFVAAPWERGPVPDGRVAAAPAAAGGEGGLSADAAYDVDGDGRVDILDAFALARAGEGLAGAPAPRDVNGDGVSDARDVDAVAMAAVSLERLEVRL